MPGREEFKREYLESIAETCSKPFAECSRMERYTALAAMIRECCSGVRAETLRRRAAAGEKIVYYFSMEFLVGRLLENYLIQLGIRDMTADILAELGEDLDALLGICDRILVLCGGEAAGYVKPAETTKNEIGYMMMNGSIGKEEMAV